MWLLIGLVAIGLAAFVALAYRKRWRWTGFAPAEADDDPRKGKTLWDWLQLLIIPAGLAVVLFALNASQASRDRRREDRRIAHEQVLAADGNRAEALRTYLQQMSDLLLSHNLRRSRGGSDVQVLARTLTFTVLPQLDGRRKGRVLEFLAAARLISGPDPKVELAGADMRHLKLDPGTVIEGPIDLAGVHLEGVDFSGTFIGPQYAKFAGPPCGYCLTIDLKNALMRGAKLAGSGWSNARFEHADMRGVDFTNASIADSQFDGTCISGASFSKTGIISTDFRAEGNRVDLSGATVRNVLFRGDGLTNIDLRGLKTVGHSNLPGPPGKIVPGSNEIGGKTPAHCGFVGP